MLLKAEILAELYRESNDKDLFSQMTELYTNIHKLGYRKTDTIKIKDKKTGKTLTHYPVKYNYEDYESKISYDSHFVTTLMRTNTGQCHSMPLYYLILAEEIGTEAYWSFSPRHSFVKIQDRKGNWHNLELTCKSILSDTHYINNSYIKAEALQYSSRDDA